LSHQGSDFSRSSPAYEADVLAAAIFVEVAVNVDLRVVPILVIAVIEATAIREAIRRYSIVVAPALSRNRFLTNFICGRLIVRSSLAGSSAGFGASHHPL
jgi:hypothetical protein